MIYVPTVEKMQKYCTIYIIEFCKNNKLENDKGPN
jgi:hypothetical protein